MGVFSKLKNIFYDEVEVDEPAKEIKIDKPVKKEIVEKPRVEEIKVVRQEEKREESKREEAPKENDNFGNERDLFRSERTFNFTQFDDDEIDLPPRRNVLEREKKVVKQEVKEPVVEQPKVFKPSPVISPIYGILDKDYKKEEIAPKKVEVKETILSANTVNYDTVRRKIK